MTPENKQKRVLTINDISCFGKCSITVILPIISALGLECVPLPTAILSTHTGGFKDYTFLDMTEEMQKILEHWDKEKIFFDCIFTGYLGNKEQINICIETINKRAKKNCFTIVDPVMGDSGKLYAGFNRSYVDAMKTLCEKADIITPNYTEACLLAKIDYSEYPTDEEIKLCFDKLKDIGTKSAVITGIKTAPKVISTHYKNFENDEYGAFSHPYINAMLHGGGDVFASVLCGNILNGEKTKNAVKTASDFTYDCICRTQVEGQYGLNFEPLITDLKKY